MQVILIEDVDKLGRSGEVVDVKPGFGRNYLIPQKLAVVATPRNLRRVEHDKRRILAQADKRKRESEKLRDRIEALTVNVARQVGDEEKLFGSVTAADVAQALRDQGVDVPKKRIRMPDGEPLRALGVYSVDVDLDAKVSAKLKVWVVAKT